MVVLKVLSDKHPEKQEKCAKKYDVWLPAEILSARKHLLMVNTSMLSLSTGRTKSEQCIMKETEGSVNGHIVVLPECLLAKRREPRQHNDHSQCSSVGTLTRLRAGQLGNRGSIPRSARCCFSSPKRPERLWGPLRLLLSGYVGRCAAFSGGKVARERN